MSIATTEPAPAPGAYIGYNAYLLIGEEVIAKIQRFSFTINNNITQTYVISSRTPLNIETRFVINGTIRKLYLNTALMRLAMGKDASSIPALGNESSAETIAGWMDNTESTPSFTSAVNHFRLPEFTLTCQLMTKSTEGTETHYITLNNVKLNTYDWTLNANEIILENVNFFAETITAGGFTSE